jgi:hypothetical protein
VREERVVRADDVLGELAYLPATVERPHGTEVEVGVLGEQRGVAVPVPGVGPVAVGRP